MYHVLSGRPAMTKARMLAMREVAAEFIGTFWLVLSGCGAAVLSGAGGMAGIGMIGIAFAFGCSALTAMYAFGHLSGMHLNPAVSIGLWIAGRLDSGKLLPYILAQLFGAVAAAGLLYVIVTGDGNTAGTFAANGYGIHSPGHYGMWAALVTEIVMTFMFVLVFLGVTDERARRGFAGLTIGVALTLIHLISMPVTNTSVNPARSLSQALFVQDWALDQLWLFIVAPVAGALLAGLFYRLISDDWLKDRSNSAYT